VIKFRGYYFCGCYLKNSGQRNHPVANRSLFFAVSRMEFFGGNKEFVMSQKNMLMRLCQINEVMSHVLAKGTRMA
jgi:hypothetical protein